jgi:hypothetical protein
MLNQTTFKKSQIDGSAPAALFRVFCRGHSMSPTIRRSDLLYVSPYGSDRVRPGDIVVFKSSGQAMATVHRALSVTAFGVRTVGDNNDSPDPDHLNPSDIVGRVVWSQRRSKLRRVRGGRLGSIIGRLMRLRRLLDRRLSRMGHPIYEWLVRHRIFRRWAFCSIRTRVVCFTTDGAQELQLLWGNRLIGWFAPESGTWVIHRPFRLFVDESSLPVSNPDSAKAAPRLP